RRHAALEGGGDLLGQTRDGVVDARRGGGVVAFHCEKGLGDGNGDLVICVRHNGAVAFDHAKLARRGSSQIQGGIGCLRILANGLVLHGVSGFSSSRWHVRFLVAIPPRRLACACTTKMVCSAAWAGNRCPEG